MKKLSTYSFQSSRMLEILTVVYLAFPIPFFLVGWVHWGVSVPLLILFIRELRRYQKNIPTEAKPALNQFRWGTIFKLVTFCIIAFFWVSLSGIGNTGYQNPGIKQLMYLLSNLIFFPWPLKFVADGKEIDLFVLNHAYLLPSSFVGKLLGWSGANVSWFLYSVFGILLLFSWISILTTKHPFIVIALFIFSGGLDILGNTIYLQKIPGGMGHLEWWSGLWQYIGSTAALFSMPESALPAWLGSCLILWYVVKQRVSALLWFPIVLIFFWSPPVFIGLLPFLIAQQYWFRSHPRSFFQLTSFSWVLFALLFLYFSSSKIGFNLKIFSPQIPDFYWNWLELAVFYMIEFGIFGLVCWENYWGGELKRKLWILAIFSLLIIPFFRFNNTLETMIATSLPSLFIFWLGVFYFLFEKFQKPVGRILLCLLLLGSFGAVAEISRALGNFSLTPSTRLLDVVNISRKIAIPEEWRGSPGSLFSRFFCQKSDENGSKSVLRSVRDNDETQRIEAEDFIESFDNPHLGRSIYASNGKFVGNDFGIDQAVELRYEFFLIEDLDFGKLTVLYASGLNEVYLPVTLDDGFLGSIYCQKTYDWHIFSETSIALPPLKKGFHNFCVSVGRKDINIDVFLIDKQPNDSVLIEAECFSGPIREPFFFSQKSASGGKVVGHFWEDKKKKLEYYFFIQSSGIYNLNISYATDKDDVSCWVQINQASMNDVRFPNTGSMDFYLHQNKELGELNAGWHSLKIIPHGKKINLDYFLITRENQ